MAIRKTTKKAAKKTTKTATTRRAPILTRVRSAIFKKLGRAISSDPKEAKRIIEEATFTGRTDPGEWSPSAAVVIHLETGIPTPYDSVRADNAWFDISDSLKTHYVEYINGAVLAVYRV